LIKNTDKKQVEEQDIKNLTSVIEERKLLIYDDLVEKEKSLLDRIWFVFLFIMLLPFGLVYKIVVTLI